MRLSATSLARVHVIDTVRFEAMDIRAPDRLDGFLSRRSVRLAMVGSVGLYLFMLCAAYMAREEVVPEISFAILGPEVVTPGGYFPVRVLAYQHKPRGHQPVQIQSARILQGGIERTLPIRDTLVGIPGVAHIGPVPQFTGPFELILTVQSNEHTRTLQVPLVVYHPRQSGPPRPLALPEPIPEEGELQPELLPESGMLASGTANRVWVRVTDRSGAPAPATIVRWSVSGAEPAEGEVETNPAGLARIELVPNRLSVRFEIETIRNEERGRLVQTLSAMGRGTVIQTNRMLRAKDEPPISVNIRRTSSEQTLYCDLYRGDAWVQTWHLEPTDGSKTSTLSLDLSDPGLHHFQCYSHFAEPGDGGDATWLFFQDEARVRAVSTLLRDLPSHPSPFERTRTHRAALPIVDRAAAHAILANYRTRTVDIISPPLLASTRAQDLEEAKRENGRVRVRFFLMIGLSFGLVILWAVYTAINTAILNRHRLIAAVAELGDLAVEVTPPTTLKRARTLLQMSLVIVVLILNVIAMLELFKYM